MWWSNQFQLLVACNIRRCLRVRPDRRHHTGVTATPAGDAPFQHYTEECVPSNPCCAGDAPFQHYTEECVPSESARPSLYRGTPFVGLFPTFWLETKVESGYTRPLKHARDVQIHMTIFTLQRACAARLLLD